MGSALPPKPPTHKKKACPDTVLDPDPGRNSALGNSSTTRPRARFQTTVEDASDSVWQSVNLVYDITLMCNSTG